MAFIKYIVVLVLLGHGAGHVMGFLAAWTKLPMGFVDRSWVFGGDVKIQTAIGRAFGLVWLVALVGFIGAGLGLLLRQEWWSALAIASSVTSIVAVVPWWNAVTPSARSWSLLVDVAVLVALLGPWRAQIAGVIG